MFISYNMWEWIKSQNQKLNGSRRFAAGALALYLVGWLADRGFTLLWEKVLEKQTPLALRQMSEFLSTDIATGMALMAVFILFVPPVTSVIFDLSASLARTIELRNRRMSRRDYIASISYEALEISKEARSISYHGRWVYEDPSYVGLNPEEAWKAREKLRAEQDSKKAMRLQEFIANRSGRARFLMKEFVSFGYAKDVPRVFDHITNYFCVEELSNILEEAAHRGHSELRRDGYPVKAVEDSQPH
ncbi:hypothetical protein [Sulfitobacter sp. M13]